jgi:6-phosphogluconolactonase (cycloisomerase 2 family)
MTTHYIGQNPDQLLASDQRFLYALRRTDEGELYFARLDQLSSTDSLTINNPAVVSKSFPRYFDVMNELGFNIDKS